VDLNFNITEAPPATAVGQVSYGTDGFGYGASLNNANLLGTGKALSLAFNKSPYVSTYSTTYTNPYYTFDGISRSLNAYAQQFNPGSVNIANYSYQTFGGGVNYGVPISSKNDMITFGAGYENEKVGVGNAPSQQVLDFFNHYNTASTSNLFFNQLLLNGGWNRDGLDRFIFPTRGLNQNANVQVSLPLGQNMQFYKMGYNAHWYHPIVRDFVFSALAGASYGNGFGGTGNLPFFQNYFSGGTGSVRGYTNNTLGPKDSLGNPIGGNLATNGTLALIFPNFISPNTLRTSVFIDGGNVYNTHDKDFSTAGLSNGHAGPIRYSAGLAVEWRIPVVGLINISLAEPINAKPGDDKSFFQFNFGTQF
jgi:outer membrane protein insertion porin family